MWSPICASELGLMERFRNSDIWEASKNRPSRPSQAKLALRRFPFIDFKILAAFFHFLLEEVGQAFPTVARSHIIHRHGGHEKLNWAIGLYRTESPQ